MTTTSELLAGFDRDLSAELPYLPWDDVLRQDVVIVVGKNDVFRFSLNIIDIHRFMRIVVRPRRFEHSVVVYLLLEVQAGSSVRDSSGILYWPYHWEGSGVNRILVFPALEKIPFVPVRRIPDDHNTRPVKTGPKRAIGYTEVVKYLTDLRRVFAKSRRQRKPPRLRPKFASMPGRANPETINWNGIFGYEAYGIPWSQSNMPTVRWYRAFTSVKTPGYRNKHRGRLPVNPYSLTWIKTEDPMGHDIRSNAAIAPWGPMKSSKTYQPSSYWSAIPSAPTHDVSNYNKALSRCISRAEVGIDGNIAQDVAQFGQIVTQITDTTYRLSSAIFAVKRHDFRSAWEALSTPTTKSRGRGYRVSGESKKRKASVLKVDLRTDMKKSVDLDIGRQVSPYKSVAENWLALQYGWKPLLEDIHGALRSIAHAMVQEPLVIRAVSASAKSRTSTVTPQGLTSDYYQKTGECRVGTISNCKIGFRYTVANRLKQFLAQTGFTNPINLAWEVLPYSFVVDWFLPIGPYLETLSAFDGLEFLDGYVTYATVQYTSATNNYYGRFPVNESPIYTMWSKQTSYWRQYVQINRVKLTTFPSAVMPSFKNPLSVTHALNGLSLLRAAFR